MAAILPVLNESMAISRHFLVSWPIRCRVCWVHCHPLASTPNLPGLKGLLQPIRWRDCWTNFHPLASTPNLPYYWFSPAGLLFYSSFYRVFLGVQSYPTPRIDRAGTSGTVDFSMPHCRSLALDPWCGGTVLEWFSGFQLVTLTCRLEWLDGGGDRVATAVILTVFKPGFPDGGT